MAANHAGRGNTSESADRQFQTSTKVEKLKSLMTNDKPDSNKGLQLFFVDVAVRPQSAQEVRMVTVGSAVENAKSIILISSALHITQSKCPLLASVHSQDSLEDRWNIRSIS